MANFLLFIFGSCIGSFVSVVDNRIAHDKKGMMFGRSQCPHCHNQILKKDLIPILSFLMLRGKCRMCLNPIHIKYPIIELISGLCFLAAIMQFNLGEILILTPLLINLLSLVIQDSFTMKVETLLLNTLVIISGLYGYFFFENPIQDMLLWGLIGFAFFYIQQILSNGKWVGDADSYLGLSIGLILGNMNTLLALFSAYWIACIFAVPYFLIKRKTIKGIQLPLFPFLALGFYIQLVI